MLRPMDVLFVSRGRLGWPFGKRKKGFVRTFLKRLAGSLAERRVRRMEEDRKLAATK